MIVDLHCCVVPDDPAEYAHMRALPHVQLEPSVCTVDNTLRRMDETGVERSAIWSIGASLEQCRRFNDFIAGVTARHPDRFIPFATVTPAEADAGVAELDRAIDDLGMQGLKFHPHVMSTALDDPRFLELFEATAARDLPFVTHVNPTLVRELRALSGEDAKIPADEDPISTTPRIPEAEPAKLRTLIETWDTPRLQAAHMGGVLLDSIRASQITFQTTGASAEVIEWAVREVGPQRIVFGSDIPFFSVEGEIDKVRRLPISDEDKAAILGGNAVDRVLRPRAAGRDHV